MSIIGKAMCFIYRVMEMVDGERIRSFVLVPYRKAEAIKLMCMEVLNKDIHGVYHKRFRFTYRHTIRSGRYNPVMMARIWKESKEVF